MDTESAWMWLAIEGCARGLVVHGLAGFQYEKAYEVLNILKVTHQVCAMFCVRKKSPETMRMLLNGIQFKLLYINEHLLIEKN